MKENNEAKLIAMVMDGFSVVRVSTNKWAIQQRSTGRYLTNNPLAKWDYAKNAMQFDDWMDAVEYGHSKLTAYQV